MKTIELTDELYDRLLKLSNNINNQDHRATAMPYFFQVQTKELKSVPEGNGTEAWHLDGSLLESEVEISDAILEYYEGEYSEDNIKDMTDYERENLLEQMGWNKIYYDYENKYQNAFLTEQSCKEHIERNKHHYNEPVDYLVHAFRNPDLEIVFEFLCGLTDKKIHK